MKVWRNGFVIAYFFINVRGAVGGGLVLKWECIPSQDNKGLRKVESSEKILLYSMAIRQK